MTRMQKRAQERRDRLMKRARKELALREPSYADEIVAGRWDQSPAMRRVLDDMELTR